MAKKRVARKSGGRKGSGKPNKTQAIKEYMDSHPGAGPKEVAEALKKTGLDVTAQYVSTIKSLDKKKEQGKGKSKPAASPKKKGDLPVSSVLAAKKLVEEVGDIGRAKAALDALKMLS